ncbi:hypothetical protein B6U91_00310 [Candidatus Pacearchaeota archaeon ex4484_71]|nr:MAG: hypothetical protein B6U91_00310 [Candidatus Pacearchaeota archaeon ex4484_71]
MAEINKDNLEGALGKTQKEETSSEEAPKMPKETEIGFHQGAITTLVNERNELMRMAGNVEAIIQAHVKRLEELGVKVLNKKE